MRTPYLQLLLPTLFFLVAAFGLDFIYPFSNPSTGGADGIKNLYTFAWYLDNNESFTNFEGMAHPYGEHIAYTDGHPFLAMMLKPIWQGLGLFGFAAPLLSILIHLSWLLTPMPLFLLLRHYGAQRTLAIAGAVGFTLLSPQILRDGGHYALAYTLAIPLSWWLTERWFAKGMKWKDLLVLALIHFFWLGTHAYLGLIAIAFSSLVFVFKAAQERNLKGLLGAGLAGMMPVLLFMIWLRVTDDHLCRLETPFGFLEFTTSFSSVFFPQSGPLSRITEHFEMTSPWEGWGYIGLSAIITLIVAPIALLFQKKEKAAQPSLAAPIIAALLLFIVASGFPFNVIESVKVEEVPLLRQFRGIGRFVWPLYYVLTLSSIVLLSRTTAKAALPVKRSLTLGFFLLLVMEVGMHLDAHRKFLSEGDHPFSSRNKAYAGAIAAIKDSGAEVLLPLPYFHVGAEMYMRLPESDFEEKALTLSYHTQLPLYSAHLTRASLSETRSQLKAFNQADFGGHLKAKKAILIYDQRSLSPYEQNLWNQSTPYKTVDGIEMRIYDPQQNINENVFADDAMHSAPIKLHWPLDSISDGRQIEGQGYFPGTCDGYTIITSVRPDSSWLGKRFMTALWMSGPSDGCSEDVNRLRAQFIVGFRDGMNSEWKSLSTPKNAFEHSEDGSWSRAFNTFDMETLPRQIDLFVKSEAGCEGELLLDDLVLFSLP